MKRINVTTATSFLIQFFSFNALHTETACARFLFTEGFENNQSQKSTETGKNYFPSKEIIQNTVSDKKTTECNSNTQF